MGTTPTPLEWGFPRLEPGATISFLCPRAPVSLSKPESKPPQLSGDFWDTTLARQADPEFSWRKAVAFFLTSSTGRRCPLLG